MGALNTVSMMRTGSFRQPVTSHTNKLPSSTDRERCNSLAGLLTLQGASRHHIKWDACVLFTPPAIGIV